MDNDLYGYLGFDFLEEDDDEIASEPPKKLPRPKHCIDWMGHKWVGVLLLTSTVYHCERCGIKKEDYDQDEP